MKKERRVIVLIIIIGIILIALGITVILSNITKDNETNKSKTINKTEEYLNNYMDISTTLNKIDNALINYYPIEDFNSLDKKIKTEFLLKILSSESDIELTKETLEKEKLNYFNKNTSLIYKSFETDNDSFIYNDKYEVIGKKTNDFYVVSKTTKEYFDNNNWIVERNIYFTDAIITPNLYPQRVYKTIEDAKNKTNEIYTINSKEEDLTNDENYNIIKDQLLKYKYTLKKDNNIYKVISIEKIDNKKQD